MEKLAKGFISLGAVLMFISFLWWVVVEAIKADAKIWEMGIALGLCFLGAGFVCGVIAAFKGY